VFCGQLLEHCARWRVFRRVDELFILVPMIGNLKGNLEMCLSARLGTSATLGELDTRRVRRSLVTANLTLLGLQALLISSLAAVISFVLGLVTTHRLGDVPSSGQPVPGTVADPSIDDPWREGYTRPGPAQLVMVLATGMAAAGISALVLGCFMCALIVMCRWVNVDPDNITPPIAACLGDLLTLFILALAGTVLVGAMDTPLPLISVIIMSIAALWFTRRVMRDTWVKDIARGSWIPLISAMLISSGTGMVLESGVGKYRGFALLAISMTGLTGAIGAIHANRLSTQLHRRLHPGSGGMGGHTPHSGVAGRLQAAYDGLTPTQSIAVLFALSFPCQGAFLLFVNATGWIDVHLGWVGWVAYSLATAFSLICAQFFTLFCWHRNLDPDSYTLPIHSAIVDFVAQLLLMLAYEVCRSLGGDVMAPLNAR
jgi:solute carrier family 41